MWKEVNLDGEDVLGLECNGKLSKGSISIKVPKVPQEFFH